MQEIILNNGISIPAIGYGTYKLPDDNTGAEAVAQAIDCGYRLIDGAAAYNNECAVGKGLKISGLSRSELFITSKVHNACRGYNSTLKAFERTLKDLDIEYLDMYMIHWPATQSRDTEWIKTNADTWRALEKIYSEQRVRAIGVCNFMPEHLNQLLATAKVKPVINQIEFNPGMQQQTCVDFCKQHDIVIEAWSPLARGRIFENEVLNNIAQTHKKSVAQICLRWEVQRGAVPIPKSSNKERMRQNIEIFDFALSHDEMVAINSLTTFGNSNLTADNINMS